MKQFAILCVSGNAAIHTPVVNMNVDLFKYCYQLMQVYPDRILQYRIYPAPADDDDMFIEKVHMIDEIISMRTKLNMTTTHEQMNYYFTYDWAALRLVHETLREEINQ